MECNWLECNWLDCKYKAKDSNDLTLHVNTHIEKQSDTYMCLWLKCQKYGEKQFSKYTVQAHVKRHTGDRPFKCNQCDKSYTRSDALNKHLKKHEIVTHNINMLVNKSFYLNLMLQSVDFKIRNEKIRNGKIKEAIGILRREICISYDSKSKNESNTKKIKE
ncbi:hypothetical protein CWI39_1195p0010 [Hamiltosporidium magnivora]|uniref:C2H2-type domain-containing protein n=1 Tax=Hamiltosporidium magnivora TaxID=148818 RepID=A0A4Q9L4W1_9MICR|nr:hypothetical protein CWI39_1195p0010 [Hamiltosporidium magnivora]TBU04205.1 hypothetical protein CWI36_0797p0020 [Hamiltosporidium magnivora]